MRTRESAAQALEDAPVVIAMFVPPADQVGVPIRQSTWVAAGRTLFNDVFHNAQVSQGADGSRTQVVVAHLAPDELTEQNLTRVGAFARKFGRTTNQREVGLVVGDLYHPITNFNESAVPEAAEPDED